MNFLSCQPNQVTYASFTNWEKAERWSEEETDRFFEALTKFGANFSFIQVCTLFPRFKEQKRIERNGLIFTVGRLGRL